MRARRAAPAANSLTRLLVASAALLASLTGCGAPRATSPHSDAPVTITWFASSITQSANDPRQVLVDAFERAYPRIHVNLASSPADTDTARATLIQQIDANTSGAPDVYLGDVTWPAEFAAAKLARPLDQYFPASFWQRFGTATAGSVPGELSSTEYEGAHYAVPFYVDEGFLFYRADLLRRYHLPVPTTWQQVVDEATTLTRAHAVREGFIWQGAAYEGLTCDWTEFLADAYGGPPFEGPVSAVARAMGSKQALTALELMRSLFTDGVSPTSVLQDQEPSDNDAFDNREAAFLRGWDASYALAESRTSRVRGDVGVAPLPRLTGSSGAGYSTIGGWDLFINPHSTHVAADVTFVNWLTGEQAQRILASQYTEIPANVAVRQDQRVAAGNPVLTAARANTGALVSRPTRLADYPSVSHDIFTAVHAALAAPAKPSGGADDAALCRSLVDAAHQIDPGVTTMRCDDLAGDGG